MCSRGRTSSIRGPQISDYPAALNAKRMAHLTHERCVANFAHHGLCSVDSTTSVKGVSISPMRQADFFPNNPTLYQPRNKEDVVPASQFASFLALMPCVSLQHRHVVINFRPTHGAYIVPVVPCESNARAAENMVTRHELPRTLRRTAPGAAVAPQRSGHARS